MDRAYGDERNPIVSKSEFVLSLFEQLIGDGMVTAKEKSILGRCTEQVYLPTFATAIKAHAYAAGLLPFAPDAARTRSTGWRFRPSCSLPAH